MKKYLPLLVALCIIFITTVGLCLVFDYPLFSMMGMNMLMGSWFIVFGGTKLLNVSGFVASFRRYDVFTQKFPPYGYIYPFIEFFLGIAYVLDAMMLYWATINVVTLLISGLTTLSILRSFSHPKKMHCACLGAHTELTIGWVTLVECGSMVIMALGMIFWML